MIVQQIKKLFELNDKESAVFEKIREGLVQGIICWNVDRLSRNAGDLGTLVDLMDEGKLQIIITNSQVFRNTPNEKFLLMILCSQAKLENDNRGINSKRGMMESVINGNYPTSVPMGYKRQNDGQKTRIVIDAKEVEIVKMIFRLASKGDSIREIREKLKKKYEKIPVFSGIQNILSNPFFTGKFEYPRGSGQRYKGNYEPIISERTYNKVRSEISNRTTLKTKWGTKTFLFSKLLRCKYCQSNVCGRILKKKNKKEYIYYQCCNTKYGCKGKMIQENDILETILAIIKIDDFKDDFVQTFEKINDFLKIIKTHRTNKIDFQTYVKLCLKRDRHKFRSHIKKSYWLV